MNGVDEIGHHRLMCGDITVSGIERLMGGRLADVIYSDPPWGPGNQKYWHTMNRRGTLPRTSWDVFLDVFCKLCAQNRKHDAPVFIEMGLRWVDDLDNAMDAVGLQLVKRWNIYYGPKSKPLMNTVALYGASCPHVVLPEPPHGEPVTMAILSTVVKLGMLVLDPCAGKGMTARITHRLGGVFYGAEMNQRRLDKAADWLRKMI